MKLRHYLLGSLALAAALAAQGQNQLTLTAAATTGQGTVTPVLTWATTPPAPGATPCQASNDAGNVFPNWSGPKAASGTITLAATARNVSFSMTCTWPGNSLVTFTWVNPTKNTNGTNYTDPKTVRIKYRFGGTDPTAANSPLDTQVDVPMTPTPRTTHTVTNVTQNGEMRAVVFAMNQANVYSAPSNVASKTLVGKVDVTKSVALTVIPKPEAPTSLVISE